MQELSEPRDAYEGFDEPPPESTQRLTFADVAAMLSTEAPEQRFIVDNLVPAGIVCGLHAEGGAGKSFFLLSLALGLACGKTIFPSCPVSEARRVLIFSGEDGPDDLHRRIARIVPAHEFTAEELRLIAENLRVCCTSNSPLVAALPGGEVRKTTFFDDVQREIEAFHPGLIIFDPRSAFFAGDENSNAQIAAFIYELASLARIVPDGASVLLSHHVAKSSTNGDLSSGRGASAARDGMRCVLHLQGLEQEEIEGAGIQDANLFAKIVHAKSNYTARRNTPIYLRRETGDQFGGVLTEVDMAALTRQIRSAAASNLARALAAAIGDNPEGLTKWDVVKNPKGKFLRDSLAGEFGDRAVTQKTMGAAYEYALSNRLITVQIEQIGGVQKELPRAAVQWPKKGLDTL